MAAWPPHPHRGRRRSTHVPGQRKSEAVAAAMARWYVAELCAASPARTVRISTPRTDSCPSLVRPRPPQPAGHRDRWTAHGTACGVRVSAGTYSTRLAPSSQAALPTLPLRRRTVCWPCRGTRRRRYPFILLQRRRRHSLAALRERIAIVVGTSGLLRRVPRGPTGSRAGEGPPCGYAVRQGQIW